jgi:hypothetical protein
MIFSKPTKSRITHHTIQIKKPKFLKDLDLTKASYKTTFKSNLIFVVIISQTQNSLNEEEAPSSKRINKLRIIILN